ncbi:MULTISPECIES: PfkB family carbohydrate kinase [Kistimonas]|uniref:PfkB family carbohydrate kinase n=1 Tax=Kistimonas scapharcae TaxID=1036133 RepID=A0ABP8V5K7_9GAMM|nr:PfkB family carbohydrate kinase [Kistimonas asteriae]
MKSNEQRVLDLIQQNPAISQKELAEKLELSRSAVAGYISQLTRKGQILGRAYVLPVQKRITGIGALTLNRTLSIFGAMDNEHTANARTSYTADGMARLVVEHLVNLGNQTSLIAWVGDDYKGDWLLEDARKIGIQADQCIILKQMQSGSRTRIIERGGKRLMTLNDMDIYNHVTFGHLKSRWPHIANSRLVFMDSDLPEEAISYIIRHCREEHIDLFMAPSSVSKTRRLPYELQGIKLLLLTLPQLEELIAEPVTKETMIAAAKTVLARGCGAVCLIQPDTTPLILDAQGDRPLTIQLQHSQHQAGDSTGLIAATIHQYLEIGETLFTG